MRVAALVPAVALLFSFSSASIQEKEKSPAMKMKKITAVLFVDEIEPCVKFWVERFGFQKTVEVPDGNKLGFAILEKDGVELMYQTYASAEKDVSFAAQAAKKGPTFLYVEVANLDEIIASIKGIDVVMPVRTTFYGSREVGIKDPADHYITFAQLGVAPAH